MNFECTIIVNLAPIFVVVRIPYNSVSSSVRQSIFDSQICFNLFPKYSYSEVYTMNNSASHIIVIILSVNFWSIFSTEINFLYVTIHRASIEHLYSLKCYFRVNKGEVRCLVDNCLVFCFFKIFIMLYIYLNSCIMCMKHNCVIIKPWMYILLKLTITTMK